MKELPDRGQWIFVCLRGEFSAVFPILQHTPEECLEEFWNFALTKGGEPWRSAEL